MQIKELYKKDIYRGNLILVNDQYPVRLPVIQLESWMDSTYQNQKTVSYLLKQCFCKLGLKDEIVLTSAYRTFQEQQQLYEGSCKENGRVWIKQYVAKAGHSEHETGLAIDLSIRHDQQNMICPDFPYDGIAKKFRDICKDYGFIERYPQDKEKHTHIARESWHFRYVGFPHSYIMQKENLCLEEYHQFLKQYSLYQPYIYVIKNKLFEIFYVPMIQEKTVIALKNEALYQVSGNNHDGFIVTVWRKQV